MRDDQVSTYVCVDLNRSVTENQTFWVLKSLPNVCGVEYEFCYVGVEA